MNNRIKCTIVGDGGVGKTAMLISYSSNQFPGNYEPTVFDNYMMKVHVADEQYEIGFFDMAGQCDYDRLRVLSYPNTTVFILCFSVVNPTSFANIETKWLPEIRRHCARAPIVLVGTQIDLRNDPECLEKLVKSKQKPIAYEEGFRLGRQIGAVKYAECSSLTQRGLKNVFDEAILSALTPATPPSFPRRKKWYSCTLSCILPN